MSNKAIGMSVVIIIIVLIGGWFVYQKVSVTVQPSATNPTATSNSTSTPQVQAQDITVGTGTEAIPGDLVSILYVGKLSNGTVFGSTATAHGNQPLSFTLGQQGLIVGFQIGINGMKTGGERVMSVPSDLGYGAQALTDASGTVIIPANSTLLFDVKLVDVKAGTSTLSTGSGQ